MSIIPANEAYNMQQEKRKERFAKFNANVSNLEDTFNERVRTLPWDDNQISMFNGYIYLDSEMLELAKRIRTAGYEVRNQYSMGRLYYLKITIPKPAKPRKRLWGIF